MLPGMIAPLFHLGRYCARHHRLAIVAWIALAPVGIDYSPFIVTRHRLQLRDRMETEESIARATATAGGAAAFAGTTVVIALCSLAPGGIPLVTTLGYTAAIAVVVAVLAATTLLPALLGALPGAGKRRHTVQRRTIAM
jgi:RND superfamily putative drug exporter